MIGKKTRGYQLCIQGIPKSSDARPAGPPTGACPAAAGKSAKCGKCHKPLLSGPENRDEEKPYSLRCGSCSAKNRVPAAKINDAPKYRENTVSS
ncbi:MAG: hypothetical protein R2860_13930 [Desulfobacterales bacterium]